jgi:hypothetical protein
MTNLKGRGGGGGDEGGGMTENSNGIMGYFSLALTFA